MASKKNPIEDLVSRTSKFVEKQKGRWDHAAWEKLVNDVSTTGVDMTDDTRRHLGNMLEAVKHFYTELSKTPKSAKSKSKSKNKSKAKPKKAAASTKKSSAKKAAAKKKKSASKKA